MNVVIASLRSNPVNSQLFTMIPLDCHVAALLAMTDPDYHNISSLFER
jgi:hypothetical protein